MNLYKRVSKPHDCPGETCSVGTWEDATPGEALQSALTDLEHVTAKWCWTHNASVVEELGGCGKYEAEACVEQGSVVVVRQ